MIRYLFIISVIDRAELLVCRLLLHYPLLAEIIEEMILSSYHLASDDDRRSEEALSFLSCTFSGSLESLMNVS
jgi:hypothetical protein